jgi:hypothetical protein
VLPPVGPPARALLGNLPAQADGLILDLACGTGSPAFEVMSLDALTLADKSVDAAISQFGFLQEGDVTASARELSRVLKDGAPFSVAAFDAMELNTLFSRAAQVLQRHVPAQLLPGIDYLTELATPGLRERLLREAGISTLHTQMFSWQVPMPSAAALVRGELEQATAEFRATDGTCTFPLACRLFWGSKQGHTPAPSL